MKDSEYNPEDKEDKNLWTQEELDKIEKRFKELTELFGQEKELI